MIDNNVAIVQEIQQNLYVTTANVNVRSGVGTSYPIIGGLYKDTIIDVVSIDNGWALLRNGTYVSAKYIVKYTDDAEWKAITTANLNMRNKAGTSGTYVILTIPKGTVVDVLMEDSGWFKVSYKGHIGWVSGKYLA